MFILCGVQSGKNHKYKLVIFGPDSRRQRVGDSAPDLAFFAFFCASQKGRLRVVNGFKKIKKNSYIEVVTDFIFSTYTARYSIFAISITG